MAGIETDRFEKVEVTSTAELHAWLLAHHEQDDSFWLVTYKKHVALEQPDDLVEALAARPPAAEHFGAFPDSIKRNTLRWIKIAKRPETRAKRIAETARLAQQNRRVPQM